MGLGVYRQIICDHVFAFVIPFEFEMQHETVLKKLNFDLLDIIVKGWGWGLQENYLVLCCDIS